MDTSGVLRYATAPARRERILELVRSESFSRASELSELLGVSEMTIRRDIQVLADRGLLRPVHGGATRLPDPSLGTDFRLRTVQQPGAKRRIAEAAQTLIKTDTSIALDAGTTTLDLARLLAAPLRLSVVTPSVPAIVALGDRPRIQVIGLGGILHHESQAFAGPATLSAIRSLRVNQLFLATTAIGHGALWCGNPWDAETKRELVAIADEVILLADSSKFHTTAMANVVPLSAVHVLVVDDGITSDQRSEVEAAGVRVLVAASPLAPRPEVDGSVGSTL